MGEHWRRESADIRGGVVELRDLIKREAEQVLEVARDDVRTVHLEVMSVDTRIAAVEERLRHGSARPRSSSPMAGRAADWSPSMGVAGDVPRMRTGHVNMLA